MELWDLFNTTKTKLMDSDDQSSVDSDKKGKIILKVGKLVGFFSRGIFFISRHAHHSTFLLEFSCLLLT